MKIAPKTCTYAQIQFMILLNICSDLRSDIGSSTIFQYVVFFRFCFYHFVIENELGREICQVVEIDCQNYGDDDDICFGLKKLWGAVPKEGGEVDGGKE